MHTRPRLKAACQWFLEDLTYRIVAKTGIPSDRYHLGKMIHQSLLDDSDFTLQIDGGTGESEQASSVLQRSIKCATAFRNFGLKHGDVILLIAPHNLDVAILMYAALYLGVIVAPIDLLSTVQEIRLGVETNKPKMIFCQAKKATDVQKALGDLNESKEDAKIVTFEKGESFTHLYEFLDTYGDKTTCEEFKPADFDPTETIAFLWLTSGTSGIPKSAAITHKSFLYGTTLVWARQAKIPDPNRMCLLASPLQWATAMANYVYSAILRYTRLQTSLSQEVPQLYDIINKYKPNTLMLSPVLASALLKSSDSSKCDFSCITTFTMGGSTITKRTLEYVKARLPSADVTIMYGLSEVSGLAFQVDQPPLGSVGSPMPYLEYKLVDPDTKKEIDEPNQPGELLIKGPSVFKGYYNNPEKTKEIFTEDGWLQTGDLLYRDENYYFYFFERLKLLLKYKGYQVSPVELERVIGEHPGVLEVAVTGIKNPEDLGDLPVACVVRRPEHQVTAQEIKDLVKNSLSDPKQLRGGVFFVDQLPWTPSCKVDRVKLRELATQLSLQNGGIRNEDGIV